MLTRDPFKALAAIRSYVVDRLVDPILLLRHLGIAILFVGAVMSGHAPIANASSTTIPINTDVKMQGVCGDPNNPGNFSNYYVTRFQFDLGSASSSTASVTEAYGNKCSGGAINCHPFEDAPIISAGTLPVTGSGYPLTWANSNPANVILWEQSAERTATKHYGYLIDASLPTTFSHSVVGTYTFWNDRNNNQTRDASENDINCNSVPSQTVTGHAARLITATSTPLLSVARVAHASHNGIGCITTILNTKADSVRLADDFPFKPKVSLRAWSLPVEVTLNGLVANELSTNGTLIAPVSAANIAYDSATLIPKLVEVCVDASQSPGARGFAVAIDWEAKHRPGGSDDQSDSHDLSMYVGVPLEITEQALGGTQTDWGAYRILLAIVGLIIVIVILRLARRRT